MTGLKRLGAASVKGVIQKAIKRSDQEKDAIYELFVKEMLEVVDTTDCNCWPNYHLIVLEKNSS